MERVIGQRCKGTVGSTSAMVFVSETETAFTASVSVTREYRHITVKQARVEKEFNADAEAMANAIADKFVAGEL